MQGILICVNSYVTKYLPITVDNKTQKGLPFNHVIKCGTKFLWSDLPASAATTTRARKARKPHFVGQSLEKQLKQKQAIINKLLETPKEDRKAFHVEEASNAKRANPQQQIESNTHNKRKVDNGVIEISKVEDNKKKNKQRVSGTKDNKEVLSDSSDETSKQHKKAATKARILSSKEPRKVGTPVKVKEYS